MLKQSLKQKLLQKLSPQQIQLMKLIQLPTTALEQRIKQEMEENPALDEGAAEEELAKDEFEDYEEREEQTIEADDINVDEYLSDDEIPSYRLQANNSSADDKETQVPYSGGSSFHEVLIGQLDLQPIDENWRQIGAYLIGNIDGDGYIRRDLEAIVDDLAFTQNSYSSAEELEKILHIIQDFDPPGVGARNLQECLLIQLRRKKNSDANQLAIRILESGFDEFTKKHYSKLIQKFGIAEEALKAAIGEIERLNPKPGNSVETSSKIVQHVIPDFTISIQGGELELTLNARNAPELSVNRSYTEMLESYKNSKDKENKQQKEAVLFVKQKLDSARWFIEAIKQRQHTLLTTMGAIMEYQRDYFLTGDERKLRPMILKDIADEINMDISTVSRVASNKYVTSPYGTHLIKSFFSESMKNDQGEDVSTKEIKKILEDAIEDEDKRKPLTDEKLALLLKEKGYPIARRTIAKYREQLNIPVARLRKEL